MNHGELEVRGGIVDGNASGLSNGDQHKRAECECVHGRHLKLGGWPHGPLNDRSNAGVVRNHRDSDERKQQRGLSERGNQRFAACAHAAEGTATVHRSQNEKEAAQRKEIDKKNRVATIAKQRGCVQRWNERCARQCGRKQNNRAQTEKRRRGRWNQVFLMEKLPEICIGWNGLAPRRF